MIPDTIGKYKNVVLIGDYYVPTTHVPVIDERVYESGYVDRYFVSKRNQLNIIETSVRDYNATDASVYVKLHVLWKISGPKYNVYDGKILQTTGVVNYNTKRIDEITQTFKVNHVITNPVQFWRGF